MKLDEVMRTISFQAPCGSDTPGPLPIPVKKTRMRQFGSQNGVQTEKGNEIWLVTLSDLLMLLMIFFVVLFGMALQKEKREPPAVQAAEVMQMEPGVNDVSNQAPVLSIKEKASASLEAELIMALQRDKGQSDVMIERIADRVILTFPERIVFDPGQALLKPACRSTLEKVASFIHDRPFLFVEVQGHTDDKPINTSRYPSNWELSVDRAMQVSRSLIRLGVNPTQLSVKGFGEYRPLLPNGSDAGRLTNRRVEIQFSVSPQS